MSTSRFSFDFDKTIWGNLRRNIRDKGKDSVWYHFLYVILMPVFILALPIFNFIYQQIFIETATGIFLDYHSEKYHLVRRPAEIDSVFRQRIILQRALTKQGANIKAIISVCHSFTGVTPEVVQARDSLENQNAFVMGESEMGEAYIVSHSWMTWTYNVNFPYMNGMVNWPKLKKIIEEVNFGGNEFIVTENGEIV